MNEPARLDLASYLPFLVNRVGVAIVEGFSSERLKAEGLTIYMWRVLAVLADTGEQRQVDLADMTSIDAPTISRLVTRLAHMKLVTRTRSSTSNREVGVALTPKGAADGASVDPECARLGGQGHRPGCRPRRSRPSSARSRRCTRT